MIEEIENASARKRRIEKIANKPNPIPILNSICVNKRQRKNVQKQISKL
jgi:hypothetical protein